MKKRVSEKEDVKKFNSVNKNHVKSVYGVWLERNRAEVLQMLSDDYKISHIALIKNCTTTAIYRIRKRMIKDGLLTQDNKLTDQGFNTVKKGIVKGDDVKFNNVKLYNKRDVIDVNDLHITVKILDKPKGYDYRKNNLIAMKVGGYKITDLKNNYKEQFLVNDVTVKTNIDSIEIFPSRIIEETPYEVTKRMMDIVFDVIKKVENLHKILLIKENYCNISISEQHWELTKNEMAKIYKIEDKGDVFRVFDKVDGKVRLVVDFSHKKPNFEGEHYSKAPHDIKVSKPYFDDLGDKGRDFFLQLRPREREKHFEDIIDDDKNFYYPVENAKLLNQILDALNQVTHAEKFVIDYLKSQLPKKQENNDISKKIIPGYIG